MLKSDKKHKTKTEQLATDAMTFCKSLAKSDDVYIIKKQLIRSASSVSVSYRTIAEPAPMQIYFLN